jgi:hypothetical protein
MAARFVRIDIGFPSGVDISDAAGAQFVGRALRPFGIRYV